VPDGGLGVWTKFVGVDLPKITSLAAKEGLLFYDGRIFNTKHSFNSTRLGFSSLTLQEQERAIGILQKCIRKAET
jgi:DNA-binding transcriptional MocR family regulator